VLNESSAVIITEVSINHDKDVMPVLRKLRPHPTARLADDLPSADFVAKHIQPGRGANGGTHWFWVERRGTRQHDEAGQATLRWRGRTYNVARVLLQHHMRIRVVRAVNACGLPQCVKPEHWSPGPQFLGVVSAAPGLATVRVGDAWRLAVGGVVVERDMAFVADHQRDRHVVRALHEEHETVFLTACGVLLDPAVVVASSAEATCAGCLR
jgi:hypothetical protein